MEQNTDPLFQQMEEYKKQNPSIIEAMKRFSVTREELRKAEDALHPVEIWESNSTIPYNEGMALYRQIKQRHEDLFRELAEH